MEEVMKNAKNHKHEEVMKNLWIRRCLNKEERETLNNKMKKQSRKMRQGLKKQKSPFFFIVYCYK